MKTAGSLQRRLSLWLSVAVVLVAVGGVSLSFNALFRQAYESQDDELRQIAGLIETEHLPTGAIVVQNIERSKDSESQLIVQVLGQTPADVFPKHHERLRIPVDIREGIQTFRGERFSWRLFVRRLPSGDKLIVGQRTRERDEIARNSAIGTLLPLIVLIPVLVILINVLVRRMLRPVRMLAAELDSRHETDLHSLDDSGVPSEIQPFTTSINRLFLRVQKSIDMQRRFVADAAHELRSPLTALSLQADNLAKIALPAQAETRLGALQNGLARARLLLEQLLSLARSQTGTALPAERMPMEHLFRQVLEDLVPLAEDKQLDVEVSTAPGATFFGQEIDGVTLLKNLLGNAIRYTPAGGRIVCRAAVADGATVVEIEDSGPGIAESEKERVFDPFYRVVGSTEIGSGLGLAIVRTIAERIDADVVLKNMADADGRITGLCATVVFPGKPA